MLKELLKNKTFWKIIKESLKEEEVLDIILFGSIVRGKEEPRDIDILVIFSHKVDSDFLYKLRKKLEGVMPNFHVIGKPYNGLFDSGFLAREAILTEGHSLKENDSLAKLFGFSSLIFFRYHLQGKSNSERMRFYYSLYGRGGEKGVLERFNSFKFSDNVIVAPVEHTEDMKEFFERKKIKFDEFKSLLPARIAVGKFLKWK